MPPKRKLLLYGPLQHGPHVSYPRFLKATLKMSPGLGRSAFRVADEIFYGKYTEAEPYQMNIEVESAFDEFHHLCVSHGITATLM